jgi:hypothetical protein
VGDGGMRGKTTEPLTHSHMRLVNDSINGTPCFPSRTELRRTATLRRQACLPDYTEARSAVVGACAIAHFCCKARPGLPLRRKPSNKGHSLIVSQTIYVKKYFVVGME